MCRAKFSCTEQLAVYSNCTGYSLAASSLFTTIYPCLSRYSTTPKKEFINPHAIGFTNTVACSNNGIKTIYISAQVGYADGAVAQTVAGQADMAYRNLMAELASVGASADHVVKLNTYTVNLDKACSSSVSRAKSQYFDQPAQPASTVVGISPRVMPELLVEIEAIAVMDD
ncbi:MAG: enamine deaminase RidA (YjgF/YER057c/UK114 family) [Paraglaciecola psychrophila]